MKKYYYIVAYDGLNREHYEEVYKTEYDRLQGLKEMIERDMLYITDKEMKYFLKNKYFSYGYDWIKLVERIDGVEFYDYDLYNVGELQDINIFNPL